MIDVKYNNLGHKITTYSNDMTIEEIVVEMAEEHQKNIKPGQGFFFDFSKTPEIKEPLFNYLIKNYGWKMDYKGKFIRKPKE